MTVTTIYGASDDLVEIEGDVSEEFGCYARDEDASWVLALSDGTLLSVKYDGCWRFKTLVAGSVPMRREEAVEEDRTGSRPDGKPWYSDVLTFDGTLEWAALSESTKFATRKKLRVAR